MAFQIRRGLEANLASVVAKEGELLYTTDNPALYIGQADGSAVKVSAPVIRVNGQTGAVTLTTDNINEGQNNLWFSVDKAQDAVGAALTAGTHSGITFTYGPTQDGANRIDATVTRQVTPGDANTIGCVPYYDTANTVSYSPNLLYFALSSTLVVKNGTLEVVAGNSGRQPIILSTYSNDALSNFIGIRKARGVQATPTSVINGDTLGGFAFIGHDGSGFKLSANISAAASQAVSTGVIPSVITFANTDTSGALGIRARITETGRLILGAITSTDNQTLNNGLTIRQTISGTNSGISFRNTFSDATAPTIALGKYRGTVATPLTVQTGDATGQIDAYGFDGSNSSLSSSIQMTVDGTVASSKIPGAITFKAANNNGVLTTVLKINNASSSTTVGTVTVSGTIATTSTPGTFWNYDSSGSKVLNMAIGQTVDFANFSGSVLVNCFNSGCVTQYLVGGGSGSTAAIGSSKGSATGTMAYNSGISGYTFTATETGDHSFYVIRTRTGA